MSLASEEVDRWEWIQDRLPTKSDADGDGEVQICLPNTTHWLYVPFYDVFPGMPWRKPVRTLFVKLTYFKKSGKFYDEGVFEVLESKPLHAIWGQVREMRENGNLPGLVDGAGKEFMVLVNVPGHQHEHPHIIV
jgi:hypothetical protein